MTRFQKPPFIADDTWARLAPADQERIAADFRASMAGHPEPEPVAEPEVSTPLNVLEEMVAERFLTHIGWNVAVRDDLAVAQAIAAGKPVDAIYTLEDQAALDDFFHFLHSQGFAAFFEELAGRMRVQRVNVPPVRYIWLYLVKLVLGIPGMAGLSPLLRDEALMRLVGFNAHEVQHGTTRRGDDRRKPGTEREGAVSTEAVAENIVKFRPVIMAIFLNQVLQLCIKLMVGDLRTARPRH